MNSQQQEEEIVSNKKKAESIEVAVNGIFASCSFADLGLRPALCQHLQGPGPSNSGSDLRASCVSFLGKPPILLCIGVSIFLFLDLEVGYIASSMQPLARARQSCISHRSSTSCKCISRESSALVLVPTQELCMQVYEILQKLLHRFIWIVPGYIMGGENRAKEKARLRKGISVLIATPGRLLDHLKNTASFTYANLRWIVFDEADRILELGFGKAIEEILDFLGSRQNDSVSKESIAPKAVNISRQNLLLSATLNEKVNHLANISLDNPVMIHLDGKKISSEIPIQPVRRFASLGSDSDEDSEILNIVPGQSAENYNLPVQLIQKYVKVSCGSRLVSLLSILRAYYEREMSQKIVVFFSTCDAVDFHYSLLSEFQWSTNRQSEIDQKQRFVKCKTFRLHGNLEHDDRRASFRGFTSEKSALLLCTDVAARGLDFPKVRCIVQYDSPGDASEYVHRVGRTARLGEKGEAILFLQHVEIDYLQELQQHGVTLQEYPLQKVLDSFPLHGQKHVNQKLISLDMHPWVVSLQKALESFISMESEMKKLAKEAFCSWIRAYTAHRGDLRRIFMVKKLHLGHVAKSFGLKEQPSLVGRSFRVQAKKRKKDQRQGGSSKRRRVAAKGK